MPDDDNKRPKPGSMEQAMFRRADAEQAKVNEWAKWRELFERIFAWLIKTKEQ